MPKIPYQAVSFPHGLPLWHSNSTMPAMGAAIATRADIRLHAASVGTPWGQPWWNTFGHRQPAFPRMNLTWRADAVSSCLFEENVYWILEPAFKELDGSEKTFLSYLLGMTQASIISEHILGAITMVHVDATLHLLGHLYSDDKRPDLIGFHRGTTTQPSSTTVPPGRILMEAKGTHKKKTSGLITAALQQVKPTPQPSPNKNLQQLAFLLGRNALRVASVAHFDTPSGTPNGAKVWSSYLEDPPSEETEPASWDDDEFLGLLVLAKLLPLYSILRDEAVNYHPWPEYVDTPMSTFRLDKRTMIGFPSEFVPTFDEYLSTGVEEWHARDHRQLRTLCRTLAAAVPTPARLAPNDRTEDNGWETAKLRSGLSLALDVR